MLADVAERQDEASLLMEARFSIQRDDTMPSHRSEGTRTTATDIADADAGRKSPSMPVRK